MSSFLVSHKHRYISQKSCMIFSPMVTMQMNLYLKVIQVGSTGRLVEFVDNLPIEMEALHFGQNALAETDRQCLSVRRTVNEILHGNVQQGFHQFLTFLLVEWLLRVQAVGR